MTGPRYHLNLSDWLSGAAVIGFVVLVIKVSEVVS